MLLLKMATQTWFGAFGKSEATLKMGLFSKRGAGLNPGHSRGRWGFLGREQVGQWADCYSQETSGRGGLWSH